MILSQVRKVRGGGLKIASRGRCSCTKQTLKESRTSLSLDSQHHCVIPAIRVDSHNAAKETVRIEPYEGEASTVHHLRCPVTTASA